MTRPIALVSVYDKEGIVDFCRDLVELGWDIISSGGTRQALETAENPVPVRDVAEITGMSPILGHRVVTLHPAIHGGLLATEKMRPELETLGYPWIDLVCVDLYPLEKEIKRPESTRESVIDMTDNGGPTLIRSAAKGGRIVICSKEQRPFIISWLIMNRPNEEATRNHLAAFGVATVAQYCLTSAEYHSGDRFAGTLA
ncbi:MAG: hypothetical protein FJ298_16095 [Planctomycetes bacterium]|nr:hypothetical protein [Planctomycetota bacterium]